MSALTPPPGAPVTTIRHRVPFYETDAMGVVHHSNYVRYFELARIRWMDEHHRPYREYVAEGLHFATTRVEVDYLRAVKYDEEIAISVWLAFVRGASLRMEYALAGEGGPVASGATEHAMVDLSGRVRRIPRAQREAMERIAAPEAR